MNAKKLGKKIAKLRKDNKFTQEELAQKLNVTYQAISKWENGGSFPDITLLPSLADLFNVSVDELIDHKQKDRYYDEIHSVLKEKLSQKAINGLNDKRKRFDNVFELFKILFEEIAKNYGKMNVVKSHQIIHDPGAALYDERGIGVMIKNEFMKQISVENSDSYANIFNIMSDPDVIKIIILLSNNIGSPLKDENKQIDMIVKTTGITKEKAKSILANLQNIGLVKKVATQIPEPLIEYVMDSQYAFPVLMMLAATELIINEGVASSGVFGRNVSLY